MGEQLLPHAHQRDLTRQRRHQSTVGLSRKDGGAQLTRQRGQLRADTLVQSPRRTTGEPASDEKIGGTTNRAAADCEFQFSAWEPSKLLSRFALSRSGTRSGLSPTSAWQWPRRTRDLSPHVDSTVGWRLCRKPHIFRRYPHDSSFPHTSRITEPGYRNAGRSWYGFGRG
jgi:hypothetical protein